MGQSDVSQIGSIFSQDLRVLKGGEETVATGVEVIINMVLAGLDGVVIGTVIIWVINKVMYKSIFRGFAIRLTNRGISAYPYHDTFPYMRRNLIHRRCHRDKKIIFRYPLTCSSIFAGD
jgi:hypothetical protein